MIVNEDIGAKVKNLRMSEKMTLKDLSNMTELSTGFLSQFERGLTSIAIDSLQKIAAALNVELSHFFEKPAMKNSAVIRNYEKKVMKIDNSRCINYLFTQNAADKEMMPRLIDILPCNSTESLEQFNHKGEEFIYVIEGILTLFVDGESYELYPGDGAHYSSEVIHNYANYTNRVVKILEVSIPNYFNDDNK